MLPNNQMLSKLLLISEILYLPLVILSFYLLVASRTGEARTVWEVLHPAFIPALFVTTFVLLTILFISEKTSRKLLFIIVYSILVHSFFSIIFPAGDLSGQQLVLGQIRRIYDSTILHGLSGWPAKTIGISILGIFKGANLQAALSTILARMLSIDIFYVHLFLIPVLWGIFVPIASFLTAKAVGGTEKSATLSSLVVSAFPYAIYFGAISVPNSLGFIFFLYSLYFMLRYLSSNDSKTAYWILIFSIFSFLSHYLTGIMSFSLLLLTKAFKVHKSEKKFALTNARILLMISFLISVSLLPLSFIYLRALGTSAIPIFTLDKINELPVQEIIGLFLLGELIYTPNLEIVFLNVVGPLLAFLWMLRLLYNLRKKTDAEFRTHFYFLFAAFLVILIDYQILKLLMEGLPLNEERLWVLRDFIAAQFVGLSVYAVVFSLEGFLEIKSPTIALPSLKKSSKRNILRVSSLLLSLNVLIPALLGAWITFSLSAAYPQVAPLQTTSYELEAVKYIEENTHEKYVVIGDQWTIYAGGVIVGINNPRAYYFDENSKTGHDLFAEMKQNPSLQWMLLAMNYTNTSVAYFIVTEPRLGAVEFNETVLNAEHALPVFYVTGEGKLYIFSYKKG